MRTSILLFIFTIYFLNAKAQNAFVDSQRITEFIDKVPVLDIERAAKDGCWSIDCNGENLESNRLELINFVNFINNPFENMTYEIDLDAIFKILEGVSFPKEIVFNSNSGNKNNSGNYERYLSPNQIAERKINEAVSILSPAENLKGTVANGLSFSTRAIDATANFLVDRTKKELTITFFNNFVVNLDGTIPVRIKIDSVPIVLNVQIKTFFPNSYLLLSSKRYFDTPSFGNTWLAAFKTDLDNLPYSIETIINSSKKFRNSEKGRYSIAILDLYRKTKASQNPIQIIRSLSNSFNKPEDHTIDSYLNLLELVSSNNLIQQSNGDIQWIKLNDLDTLSDTEKKYYVSLILRQGVESRLFSTLKFQGPDYEYTLEDVVLNSFDTPAKYINLFEDIVFNLQSTTQLIKELKSSDKKITPIQYAEYISKIQSLMDQTVKSFYSMNDSNEYYNSDYYLTYGPITNSITNLVSSVTQENYGQSLLMSINLLNLVLDSSDEGSKKFTKNLAFYGNILVDVVDASKDKNYDIQGLIENYALPVGSYRIKRKSDFSWDVSAYPGMYAGYETRESNSFSYGITAPIGFSYSWRNCEEEIDSSSSSIFFSVVDIGAPFSYRFRNDEAEGLPENIEWSQIFSPGLTYAYGFKNSPLAITAGIQYTPLLRTIENNMNQLNAQNVLRLQVGINVDIPMFNLKKGID